MSDLKSKPQEFSWFRRALWPVYAKESETVFVMICMLALALFNYTCLRINKDVLVMTAYGSGKDVLPFLKGYIVLPVTLFFVKKFWDWSNNFSKKNLFYVTLIPFLLFFVVFSLFIYPFVGYLHASPATIDAWQAAYPRFHYVVAAGGNWAYSLFYVFAELWGNVVISLLFWNFANAAFSREQAKRIFPIFASYSNFGLISAGLVTDYFARASIAAKKNGTIPVDATTTVLACVVVSALLFAALYWYLNEKVLPQQGFDINAVVAPKKGKTAKPSFMDSVKTIFSSRYLLYVTILVLAYGMTANLVEVTWKGLIKSLYPSKDEYTIFMSNFFILTGLSTFFIGLLCNGVVKRFGWLFGSLVTPIIMLITSVSFYVFLLFGYLLPAAIVAHSILYAVIIGSIQNILSKGAKYTLFDPTVQMSYQPLDDELKVKGKAAVDVIGGRLGKSLGGYLQVAVSTILVGWEYGQQFGYMLLVVGLCLAWIYASIKLSVQYNQLVEDSEKVERSSAKASSQPESV